MSGLFFFVTLPALTFFAKRVGGSHTPCASLRVPLQWEHAGQGGTRSFRADGVWGLLGRRPERARELAAHVGEACGV
jgi:hypothetical protein